MRASLSRLFRGLRVGFSVGLLGLWAVSGCATGPDPILTTGGKVPPTIENSLRCPSGTHIVFGRIAGVQTAAWCERSAVPAGAGPGVKHGPYVEWYETLQKKVTGLHEEGLRQGPWRFYMPSGVLDSEIVYDRGNVVSQTSAPTPSYVPPSAAPLPAPAAPATAPAVAPSAAPSATPAAPAAAPPAPLPAPVSPTAR